MPVMRGLNVLEVTGSAAAAYAARLFASAGSEVVMLEPPGGSALRGAPPWLAPGAPGEAPRSAAHEFLNAYKRSVALDLDDERVDALFAWADLVVSSSDGNTASALALHGRVGAANPAAVHVVTSGFGLSGRWAGWRNSALIDWASGGHLYITGQPDREPLQGGGPWDSYLAGATAAVGAQAALFRARRTGRGELVDVGAMESGAAAHQWSLTMYTHTGAVKRRWGNRLGESHHPMSLFRCADGWVCIGAASREHWENLCIAIDQVELLADERLYAPAERFDRAEEIDAVLDPWLAARSAADVVEILQAHRVPAGRVLTMTEVLRDPQLEVRALWATPEHLGPDARLPGAPFRIGPVVPFRRAPELGEHTGAVLAEAAGAVGVPGAPSGESRSPSSRGRGIAEEGAAG
jgi:crotonobetainyl-CoA:carnitine CoA-transferase CaiB-like acyl-CoA transferase